VSKVQEVETASFARNAGGTTDTTIQIPEVATLRMEGGALLKKGQWLLLSALDHRTTENEDTTLSWKDWLFSGGKRQKQHETRTLLFMLRAERTQLPLAMARHASPSH